MKRRSLVMLQNEAKDSRRCRWVKWVLAPKWPHAQANRPATGTDGSTLRLKTGIGRNQLAGCGATPTALLVGGTGHAVAGDQSPGRKAATSRRTPEASRRAKNREYCSARQRNAGQRVWRVPYQARFLSGRLALPPALCSSIHSIRRAPQRFRTEQRPRRARLSGECGAEEWGNWRSVLFP